MPERAPSPLTHPPTAYGTRTCVLRADGHPDFTHVSTGNSDHGAVEFCVQVWLLAHPERRVASNIRVTITDFEPETNPHAHA